MSRFLLRRLWWRATGQLPCKTWPCKRCDQAGRTSWRSRERWLADRRRWMARNIYWPAAVAVAIWAVVLWRVTR